MGPAAPSTALVALQVSGLNCAWMLIGTAEVRMPAQMAAACVKQLSRCWPMVVPGLPPTGAAGVASLNPSPAPSRLMMLMGGGAKGREQGRGAERAKERAHGHFSSHLGATGATGGTGFCMNFTAALRPGTQVQPGFPSDPIVATAKSAQRSSRCAVIVPFADRSTDTGASSPITSCSCES